MAPTPPATPAVTDIADALPHPSPPRALRAMTTPTPDVKRSRSSGCRVCVSRRIKCDLTKPVCLRCQTAGRECDGPRSLNSPGELAFVIETQESLGRSDEPRSGEASRRPSQISSRSASSGLSRSASRVVQQPSPVSEDVFFTFFLNTMFRSSGTRGCWHGNRAWLTRSRSHPHEFPTASLAVKCLATSYFGRIHRDASLKKDAMQMYSASLVALSASIQDPEKVGSFDVVATTMIMHLYENVNFTSRNGWIQHCQGSARLIQMKGPKSFAQGDDWALFALTRWFLTLEAISTRRRTFLEDEEWWEFSESLDPALRCFGPFVRIATRLARQMEEVDSLHATFAHTPANIQSLENTRTALLDVLSSLHTWLEELYTEPDFRGTPHPSTGGAGLLDASDSPLFSDTLTYTSIDYAMFAMYSNACCIVTLRRLRELSRLEAVSSEAEILAEYDMAPHIAIIVRSIDYCLQPIHLYQGSNYLTFAAHVVYRNIPQRSKLALWIQRVLWKVSNENGFEIARDPLWDAAENPTLLRQQG